MRRSDVELAAAVAAGDRDAAEEMVGRLLERVRCACRYAAGASGDWEDLVQTVMVEILRSAGSFSGESSLEKWSNTITMRTLWRRVRSREKYRRILRLLRESNTDPAPVERCLEEKIDSSVVRSKIALCLDRISTPQRISLVMRFVFGCSVKEIAAATGASENTVKDPLKKEKNKLKMRMMEDEILKEYVEHLKS